MAGYYDELLKLCGFEIEEINQERPRIEKALQKLQIGPDDMEPSQKWVRQNHDVELEGVRKLLAAWLKELIDLVLARDEGKKLIYFGFPAITRPGFLIASASEEIYCACPDVILCHTMGQIFNKLNPILEAGEQNGLPPGHALCSLWQIKVGALVKGIIPAPDMAIASSYYCDMGSKADDLLHELYGTPIVYVDGSMDSVWGEYPDCLPQRIEFLGEELNHLFDEVKRIVGVEVTSDAWQKVVPIIRQYYGGVGKLTELMKADPIPIYGAEAGLAAILGGACTGRGISEGSRAIAILIDEVRKRVEDGVGVVEKGAPRVIVVASSFSDASMMRMVENAGLAVPQTFFTSPPPEGKVGTNYTSVGEIMAATEIKNGLYHSSYGIIRRMADIIEHSNFDGVIHSFPFSCRPAAQISHLLKKYVEENTGTPVLSLETDLYDSRYYSAAAMRTRVETFAEMLRARKATAII